MILDMLLVGYAIKDNKHEQSCIPIKILSLIKA